VSRGEEKCFLPSDTRPVPPSVPAPFNVLPGMVEIPHLQAKRGFVMPATNVTPVKTGVHPLSPRIWIPFFNGMTDAVRHLDSGRRRNDERKCRLLVDEFRTPRFGAEGHSVCYENAISLRPLHLARMEADDGCHLLFPTAPEFLVGVAA